ncbi:MAG: ATP adenylyltransferase family protein [Myxococcota bacterium]
MSERPVESPVDAPDLAERARRCSASARATGALVSLPSEVHGVEEAGVRFAVRVLGRLDARQRSVARPPDPGSDPFLPYEQALFVADLSATHVALLNKFNVIPLHLLLVTRAYRSQDEPLDADDFTALWRCLGQIDGLGFYNGGTLAGASQPHKHLQIVPPPLGPGSGAAPIPIEPLIAASIPDDGVGRCEALPFPHALASTVDLASLAPERAARASVERVRALQQAAAPGAGPQPYNLLVTRRFALWVPRRRESWHGVPINGLGFAGALLVRNRAELERLRDCGPLAVLAHVAGSEPPA